MVIVTQNQYILASKIHHITMDERVEYLDSTRNGRTYSVANKYFQISVIYTPDYTQSQHQNGTRYDETRECSVIVRGHVNAHLVFKNLIQQIREQMPDQLFLDRALESMLGGVDLDALRDKDLDDKLLAEEEYDRGTKKVRRTRKAKGNRKSLLRKSKKRR